MCVTVLVKKNSRDHKLSAFCGFGSKLQSFDLLFHSEFVLQASCSRLRASGVCASHGKSRSRFDA